MNVMETRKLKESELAVYKNRKEAFKRAPDNIKTALENKVEKHNKDVNNAKTKKTDKFTLAVVFWRGVGAYKQNPESVRPSVVSPEQWGLGRVNGFLYALKKGKFKVKPFDQDLLPKGHPHSSRSMDQIIRSVSQFNDSLPLAPKDTVWGWFAGANDDTLDGDNWERYKKAHAWYDPSEPQSRHSYKLPFARMIDGELKVVFFGVASAMGAITRELKGQDPKQDIENIPLADYIKIYNLLSKYYEKFGEEPPAFPDKRIARDLGVYKKINDVSEAEKEILLAEMPESMNFPMSEIPYPDDEKTEEELKFLIDLSKYRNKYRKYIEVADEDLTNLFYEYLEDNNLEVTKDIKSHIDQVLHDSTIFILKTKYYYNRPRPYQVAERLGLDFVAMDSKTAHTPSYPSGHTIQAMMLADCIGYYYPEHKGYLYQIADKISLSRMYGGYHFPSDIRYAKMIFADYMKYKKEQRTLDSTIGGYFDDKVVSEKLEFDDLLVDLDSLVVANRKKEVTNFPKRGDDLKVSLRNSNWQVFPIDFAERIKKDYPSIWAKGGNIKGNDQYRDLVPVQKRGGNVTNKREEDAVRLREAWVARHYEDFRIAGVIAQIKWLAVGSRGLKYMKDLVREEMKKVDEKNKKRSFCSDDFTLISSDNNEMLLKSKEPMHMNMFVDYLEERNMKVEGSDDKGYIIKGIASSTSVDHYGTEMSLQALRNMKEQIEKGVVILPRHESMTGGAGLAEWDEVIGRTVSSEIKRANVAQAKEPTEAGYILEVTSRLYEDDERSKSLMKRLNRGELIGQSIGGWFEHVRVVENSKGELERVIVEDVVLDHIAITRAPANPDSHGLSLLNVRSKINNFLNGRSDMDTENRDLDDTAVVVEPKKGESDAPSGDGHVEPVNSHNPFVKADEEEVKGERATPLEEELEGELDEVLEKHEELQEDYDSLKAEYEKVKSEYEEMLENKRAKAKEIEMAEERMKEEERMKQELLAMKEELAKEIEEQAKELEEKAEKPEEDRMMKEEEDRMMKEEMAKEEMAKEELAMEEKGYKMLKAYMEKMMKEELSLEEKERMMKEIERMMKEYAISEKEEERSISSEDTETLDTRSKVGHNSIDKTIKSVEGETMNKDQMQELAEMIARSVASAVTPVKEEAPVETKTETIDPTVAELRSELAKTQNMLAEVMRNPVRRGRHVTTTITGVGARGAFGDLITRSRNSGSTALSAVVEHNVDKLGTEKIAQISSHELRSMLSAGLNAAQRDGLLGQALSSWE